VPEVGEPEEAAVFETVPALFAGLVGAGLAVEAVAGAGVAAGVMRGTALSGTALLAVTVGWGVETVSRRGGATVWVVSVRGEACRCGSRTASAWPLAGAVGVTFLAFKVRFLIRELAGAAFSKLSSPGDAPGSGWAEGLWFSGMTHEK
jgi:hypothetical protein